MEYLRFDDPEINPELVWGSDFKILEIEGRGTGNDFGINGLNLPREWETLLPNIRDIDKERNFRIYDSECQVYGYNLLNIDYDTNNVVKEFSIQNTTNSSISRLYLSSDWPLIEKGIYASHNLDTIESAFLLQNFCARFLGRLTNSNRYAFITGAPDTCGSHFGSQGLAIPEYCVQMYKSGKTLTNNIFQEKLTSDANNIAGRFGLDLLRCDFDEKGLLTKVRVTGNRCDYDLDEKPIYETHNVDHLDQAFALHTICARYINHLLDIERHDKE